MNDYFDLYKNAIVNIIARIIIIRKKLDIFLLAIENLMKKLENHILIFIT